jgi:methyl-accepting chemotaxis protein
VSIVCAAHKYRAGVFNEAELRQSFDTAQQRISENWTAYSATKLTDDEAQRMEKWTDLFSEQLQGSTK